MSSWQATAARIVLFPTGDAQPPGADVIFSRVYGLSASRATRDGASSSTAQGAFEGFDASCSVQPLRIDLGLGPAIPTSLGPPKLTLITDIPKLRSTLEKMFAPASGLAKDFSITRVALFIQFSKIAPNVRTGNEWLVETLNGENKLSLGDQSDFILQINNARQSEYVKGIVLNYLTRWSLDNFKFFAVPLGSNNMQAGAPVGGEPLITEHLVANVVFDNNNRPSDKPLSAETLEAILKETLAGMPAQNGAKIELDGFP
jgi:hypothetical protein